MTAPTCGTCRFRIPDTAECRRMPPTQFLTKAGIPIGCWPLVSPKDWCGEHTPKGEG